MISAAFKVNPLQPNAEWSARLTTWSCSGCRDWRCVENSAIDQAVFPADQKSIDTDTVPKFAVAIMSLAVIYVGDRIFVSVENSSVDRALARVVRTEPLVEAVVAADVFKLHAHGMAVNVKSIIEKMSRVQITDGDVRILPASS